jgi:hypothetical protein
VGFLAFALLEVMDKEWPLWFVVALFVGLGLSGLLLCRRWRFTAIFILALVILGGVRQLMELNDPYVGPAIRNEAGFTYVVLSYVSIGLGMLLPLMGVWQGCAMRKRQVKPPAL